MDQWQKRCQRTGYICNIVQAIYLQQGRGKVCGTSNGVTQGHPSTVSAHAWVQPRRCHHYALASPMLQSSVLNIALGVFSRALHARTWALHQMRRVIEQNARAIDTMLNGVQCTLTLRVRCLNVPSPSTGNGTPCSPIPCWSKMEWWSLVKIVVEVMVVAA